MPTACVRFPCGAINSRIGLLVEDVFQYEMRDDEVVEKCKMIINGKEHTVERILKDGTNYIKIRDVADAIGYSVTSKGNVAVLTKK